MKNQMHDNHRGLNIHQLKKLLGSLPVVGAPDDLEARLMRDIRAAQKKSPTAAPRHLFPRYTLVSRSRRRRLTGTSSAGDMLRGGLLATVAALLLVSAWANFGETVERSAIDAHTFVPAVIDLDAGPQATDLDTEATAPRISSSSKRTYPSKITRNGVAENRAQMDRNASATRSFDEVDSTPETAMESQRTDSTPAAISSVDSAAARSGIGKILPGIPDIILVKPSLISVTPPATAQSQRDTVQGVRTDTPRVKTGQPVEDASQRQTGPSPIRK